jgi:uncharacterized protein YbjT (DUF2867 family)
MINVLITAATGNVGSEVLKKLQEFSTEINVFAGIRQGSKTKFELTNINCKYRIFDFSKPATFEKGFTNIDTLFLLLPPGLKDFKKIFQSIIYNAKKSTVKHIIYMSVKGAGEKMLIPHYTIENIIATSGIDFTFLRPAYFMQNFVSTLKNDIKNRIIYLPAGESKFNLVDIRDIANVTYKIILNPKIHIMQKYDLTANERLTFQQMTDILNQYMEVKIQYQHPDPLTFAFNKLKQGNKLQYILILIMLHYLPRFQKPLTISDYILSITGQKAISFNQFAFDYQSILNS